MRRDAGRLLGMLLTVLIPIVTALGLYHFASEHQVEAFWDQTPGAVMLYGQPPDSRYLNAYHAVAARARAQGFVFVDPRLVQTGPLLDLWYVRWSRSAVIAVPADGMTIIIDARWMVQFRDEDLECVFAHELGHVVEFQELNPTHPFFIRTECLTEQTRADAFGRLVCGYWNYQRVIRRYIKSRPLVLPLCNGTDPVF